MGTVLHANNKIGVNWNTQLLPLKFVERRSNTGPELSYITGKLLFPAQWSQYGVAASLTIVRQELQT
jgi:hypothetical protein